MSQVTKKSFKSLADAVGQLHGIVEEINKTLPQLDVLVAACVKLLGQEEIHRVATELLKEKQNANEAELTKQVQGGIDSGKLVVTDVVAKDSFVVTREDNNGHLSRGQFDVASLPENLAAGVLGKKVGDQIEVPNMNVTIIEIYTIKSTAPDLSVVKETV